MNTPWGRADHVHTVADGIVSVSTPGHGGYRLSPARLTAVRNRFPKFVNFAGGQWFEEDCDWAIVALVFAEHFPIESIRGAVQTVRQRCRGADRRCDDASQIELSASEVGWLSVGDWLLNATAGQLIQSQVDRWEHEHAAEWECGSMSGGADTVPPRYWSIHFTRIGDKAKRVVVMPYPEKSFYTDAELDELAWDGLNPAPRKTSPAKVFNTFREEECSGAFDGFNVTSDADPGL